MLFYQRTWTSKDSTYFEFQRPIKRNECMAARSAALDAYPPFKERENADGPVNGDDLYCFFEL